VPCLLRSKANTDLDISIFNSVDQVPPNHWNRVTGEKNIYLSLPYLDAVEKSLSNEIDFRYLIFYNEKSMAVAIAVVQTLSFIDKGFKEQKQLCTIRNKIREKLVASSGIQVRVCGSPFACGENGFMFTEDIGEKEAYDILAKGLILLQKTEKNTSKVPVMLVKEFWPETFSPSGQMKEQGFKDFMVDVNMVMKINPDWKTVEDYLFSMVTKFRTKAKCAYKNSSDLKVVDFQVEDMIAHKLEIEGLYQEVLEKSPFKFGSLNGNTFIFLKKKLKNNFFVKGYFLNNELVGFSSAFVFNKIIDANYVGINYKLNQKHAIYQRMLYDYVELAIESKCKELRFGRTAEEIKSAVGAKPVNMKLYIRHQSHIKNSLLKSVMKSVGPSSFELRYPFKAIYQEA